MEIPDLKAQLRKAALARRAAVTPNAARIFAARLADQAMLLAQASQCAVASAYWPLGREADTAPLLVALAAAGVVTALPVTVARGAPLLFRAWRRGDPFTFGQMAIREPLPAAPEVEPDLLFVPLAAFDRRGHRIGYGAGHYDCTLAALRQKKPILAVGIAYAAQEISVVPNEEHDARLDYVLTEHELIDCRTV